MRAAARVSAVSGGAVEVVVAAELLVWNGSSMSWVSPVPVVGGGCPVSEAGASDDAVPVLELSPVLTAFGSTTVIGAPDESDVPDSVVAPDEPPAAGAPALEPADTVTVSVNVTGAPPSAALHAATVAITVSAATAAAIRPHLACDSRMCPTVANGVIPGRRHTRGPTT
jgi:hypothetical protein